MIINKDSRTDNWAGHRDYNRSNYHNFPRTAREAGFYYGPTYDDDGPYWPVYIALAIIVGLIYWLG
jgi:hypothetical protein